MARQIIGFGRLFEANELIENVEAVTEEDVRLFAESIARSPNPAVAVVGSGKASLELARETHRKLAA
jgi:predicted Zn-dependent peptidase